MNNKNKYLSKNIMIFFISIFGTKLVNFILLPLYSYKLSPYEYGIVDLLFNISTIISTFLMCNIGEGIKRYLLDKNSEKTSVFNIAILWIFIGFINTILLFLILNNIQLTKNYAFLLSISLNFVLISFLRGLEKLIEYAFCNILLAILIGIFNIIYIVIFNMGIDGYIIAYFLSYIICNLLILVLILKEIKLNLKKIDKKLFKAISKFSILLVPNSLLWWITNSSDKLMVTYFIGSANNGIYSMAYKIPSLLTILSTIFIQSWEYTSVKEKNDFYTADTNYDYNIFSHYCDFITIVSSFLMVILYPITKLFLSSSYIISWKYGSILILGFLFMTIGDFIGTSYYVEKKMKGNLISSFLGALINIMLNFLLIPILEILGAAIATMVSYFVMLIFRILNTRKLRKYKINGKQLLLNLILVITMCILSSINLNKYIIISKYLLMIFIIVCKKNFILEIIKLFKIVRRR